MVGVGEQGNNGKVACSLYEAGADPLTSKSRLLVDWRGPRAVGILMSLRFF